MSVPCPSFCVQSVGTFSSQTLRFCCYFVETLFNKKLCTISVRHLICATVSPHKIRKFMLNPLFLPKCRRVNPFPTDILYSSKLKEFADNNFELHENGGMFSKRVEKGIMRNCSLQAFSPFPTVFPEDLYWGDVKIGA